MAPRLLAIAAALAVSAGGSLGAAVAAGTPTAHVVKKSKAARCKALARLAGERGKPAATGDPKTRARAAARRAAKRRAAARRARKLGCKPAAHKQPKPGTPVARPGTVVPAPAGTPDPVAPSPSAPSTPPEPVGADPPAPAPPPPTPVVSTVGAGAYDMGGFLLRLTRASVAAGSLTVFFRNYDVSDHNLWIEGPGGVLAQVSDAVGEGGGGSLTLPVTPGSWRLFCSLPDHAAMTSTLTVAP